MSEPTYYQITSMPGVNFVLSDEYKALKEENERLRSVIKQQSATQWKTSADKEKEMRELFEAEHRVHVNNLKEENERLKDALMDMVAQHCHIPDEKRMFSCCLHANADAMRLLGELGLMKIDDRGYRVVYGVWPEQTLSQTEEKK